MQQVDSETYKVKSGEDITVTVVAHKVDEKVTLSFSKQGAIDPDSEDPLVFTFTIASAPVSQFADIECEFADADPDDAFFQVFVKGSKGGGKFVGPSIRKSDDDPSSNIQFTIA